MKIDPSIETIFVTGGAGFIGSHLVRHLLARRNTRVVTIDALRYAGCRENLESVQSDPHHSFIHLDVGDPSGMAELLERYQPTAIIHLAAESHVDRSVEAPEVFATNNVVGTVRLMSTTLAWWRQGFGPRRDGFRFIQVSTDEVYGSLGDVGRFREGDAYAPNSPYSASKAAADHFARAFHKTYGFPVITTHSSNNYGPYQFPEKLIPVMILNALAGTPMPVYGTGHNVRDWIYVDDHCSALVAVLAKGLPGRSYNIGGGCELTNLELVQSICDLVAGEANLSRSPRRLIEFVSDRPGHDFRYAIDCSRIHAELGWSPCVPFGDGLRRTVRWYLEHREWVERALARCLGVRRSAQKIQDP